MDIKKYIASGILEDYALNLLSEEDRYAVEQNLAKYPEIKAELEAIQEALGTFVQAHGVPVSDKLSSDILHHIDQLEKAETQVENEINNHPIRTWVAVLLILALIFLVYLIFRNQRLDRNLVFAETQLVEQQNQFGTLRDSIDILLLQLEAVREKCEDVVLLKGTAKAPKSIAFINYDVINQKTFLELIDFPIPPAGKQYQLWAYVDNDPIKIGGFDLNSPSDTIIEMLHVEKVNGFIITLEEDAGIEQPTQSEMYAFGRNKKLE